MKQERLVEGVGWGMAAVWWEVGVVGAGVLGIESLEEKKWVVVMWLETYAPITLRGMWEARGT